MLERTTAEFDEHSVPARLLRDHRVAPGTWGRLVVRAGGLRFGFGDDAEFEGAAGESVVIPPDRAYHPAPDGPVRLVLEFHRPTDTVAS